MSTTVRLAFTAVLMALCAVATLFLKVPGPTGYYHLGDGVYYAAALAFGPAVGAVVGGLGGALADVLGGYANWAPFTLLIKGLGGWVIGRIGQEAVSTRRRLAALIAGALITVTAYPLITWQIAGWPAAAGEFYFDLGQVTAGILVALVLTPVLRRALRRR